MSFHAQLYAIEDLAETDLAAALQQAIALAPARPADLAARTLLVGTLTARTGDLDEALPHLEAAATAAQRASLPLQEAEARITAASVHAAKGDYDQALTMLRHQIARLPGIRGGEELLQDALAELQAYETLTRR